MKCATDYRALRASGTLLTSLSRQALTEAIAERGEAIRPKAVSYIALSWSEAGVEWLTARPGDGGVGEKPDCCRTTVGLEFGRIDQGRGFIHSSIDSNKAARDFLLSKGWIDPTTRQALGGLGKPNSNQQAYWLEWVVSQRDASLLHHFSLGPTQMHLAQSALTGSNGGQGRCGWPNTWDDIWALYTSGTIGAVLDRLTYLSPGCITAPYPALGGDPRSTSIAWLTSHAGNKERATGIYEGTNTAPGTSYETALYVVRNLKTD